MSRTPLALRRTLAVLSGVFPALLLPASSGADTCSGLDLAALGNISIAASNPIAVAAGDFNRDGKLDVALLTSTNLVSIMLGTGTGTFAEATGSPVSTSGVDVPSEIVAGDLDQDGAIDLVVSSAATTTAKVLRGQGNGQFTPLGQFPLGTTQHPGSRLYLGRFTPDADLDLVALDEAGFRIRVYRGTGGTAFDNLNPSEDIDLAGSGETPSAAAVLDFNRDGKLDLAVAMSSKNLVRVYYGDGAGKLSPGPEDATGDQPVDVAAGDLDRDGWLDVVTADRVGRSSTTLRNESAGTKLTNVGSIASGSDPTRVGLVDIDRDGILDLAVLDEAGKSLNAFAGQKTAPFFDPNLYKAALPLGPPRGLAPGDFTGDGRTDFVTAFADGGRFAGIVENRSGMPCVKSSFAGAPRSFPAGNNPRAAAAADFDGDGRPDLAVVSRDDTTLRVLRNGNTGFEQVSFQPLASMPHAVATADFNADGNADVVVARGGAAPGIVQIFLGTGTGTLALGDVELFAMSADPMAVVVGDWNGDGAPDVAAAGTGTNTVYVFLNDLTGNLNPSASFPAGGTPRAIAAADFDGDLRLDLAVANFGGNSVSLYSGNGNGTFAAGPVLGVGTSPQGIAAADLNGDGRVDLATANNGSANVSVLLQNAGGGFASAVSYPVAANPVAVSLLDLKSGDGRPELVVAMAGPSGPLTVITNQGNGTFVTPGIDNPLRYSPQSITPIDADSDGLVDLAIACSNADAVVILLQRPPGPPVFSAAPTAAVGGRPHSAAVADLDGDGDLDLVVANSSGNTVSFVSGDGAGALSEYATQTAKGAESVATADFNGDGRVDVVVSAPGEAPPAVLFFFGAGGGVFAPQPPVSGGLTSPDDLAVGDFDDDGDVDVALCDKDASVIRILRNGGAGTFTVDTSPGLGGKPTSIVAADFDRDGDLDLAAGFDTSSTVAILVNSGGSFALGTPLTLAGGDTSPLSLTVGDYDVNGTTDLVATAFTGDRLHVFRNSGTGVFAAAVTFDAPALLQFASTADVNRDGAPDLVSVGAGLSVLRGKAGGITFDPPETVVAGLSPYAAVVADFDRDGLPDVVVVNEGSDNLSLLRSTQCRTQRLEVTAQPLGCGAAGPPFSLDAAVTAFDDGGNVAVCAANSVARSIAPGTGDPTANLSGPGPLVPVSGVATFNGLTIDKPGRRYRLQFTTLGAPPAHSRSFTLGASPEILGPSSVCPASSGTWNLEGAGFYDSFAWSINPPGAAPYNVSPFAFTPAVTLPEGPLTGSRTLGVTARVDSCVLNPTPRSIYFGSLQSVLLQTLGGVSSVCVDCIGGSAKAIETGGGSNVARQWGYRTVSTSGAITQMPGETGEIYVLKGASFPGPGTYYVVVTSTPTPTPGCGLPQVSNEWTVTVTDLVSSGEVRHLAATSTGTGPGAGRNLLQWVNTTGTADEIRVRWNKAATGTNACLPPTTIAEVVTGEAAIIAPAANAKDDFDHTGLELDTAYCYSVFVSVGGSWSPGRTIKARPFDSATGKVKWAYATGGTAVAPPTVSGYAILALSNDRTVHALARGGAGGSWPGPWMPAELAGVAHSRSPAVPFAPALGGSDVVLFTVDDASPGRLHAIDARTGLPTWAAQPQASALTGAPGGMFVQYGGVRDALFVGTRNAGNNSLRALSLADGTLLEAYGPAAPPGPIGPINGSPAIDYATRRIYFASRQQLAGHTLFCLEIQPGPGLPVFGAAVVWSRGLGDISGSPVLRNGRVYVGTDAGMVYSLDAATGGDQHSFPTSDGAIKGFIFPDRRAGSDDIMFATASKVWSVSDNAPTMTLNWSFGPPQAGVPADFNPSIVLYRPQTNFLYVGNRNGELYQLDFTSATPAVPPVKVVQVLGGGQGQIGAPSLDIGVSPPMLIVGSESGVLYGVEVPLP